jgi:hypothetical protein
MHFASWLASLLAYYSRVQYSGTSLSMKRA